MFLSPLPPFPIYVFNFWCQILGVFWCLTWVWTLCFYRIAAFFTNLQVILDENEEQREAVQEIDYLVRTIYKFSYPPNNIHKKPIHQGDA